MAIIFYLAGIVLAGFSGFAGLDWYFIFISSFLMAVGWFVLRAPQIQGIASRQGTASIPKLLVIQVVVMSFITAPIYLTATLFN